MPADYNIPMSDAQITQALQLMVERVSEGWAQETYDGSPVGPGSPYYHKSSKYWATRSEDAAARAEAAVPAGTEGAVFFSKAQSLTDAQQEQARQNIKAGGSNRNLLDNPFFSVNQRGNTSGNFTATTKIDRWRTSYATSYNGTWTLSGGVLTINADSSYVYFVQRFEDYSFMSGKTLTASLMLSDGTIVSGTAVRTTGRNDLISVAGKYGVYIATSGEFTIQVNPNQTLAIKAVKLELGSVSTLANDAPPNLAEELAKCQRYFVRIKTTSQYPYHIGFGVASSTTALRVTIPTPVSMRAMPTSITFSGSLNAYGNGLLKAITSLTGLDYTANGILVSAAASDLAINEVMALMANSIGTYIDISADL